MSEHHAHADASDPFQKKVAIAMSVYAVLLAFTTMLTNQARTEALLLSNEASNKWGYYQAKSTKGIVVKAEAELLGILAPEPAGHAPAEGEHVSISTAARERLEKEAERYEKEKEEIKEEANKVVEKGEVEKHKEHWFEYAATTIELAIIIATIGLLLSSRPAFYASMVTAAVSVGLTAWTALH